MEANINKGINIDNIAECIKIICNNYTEVFPLKNILYAKMVTLAGLKNVKFDSLLNTAGEMPLAHYCLNFLPSGGHKNASINAIDKYLFDFVKEEINKINNGIKEEYIDKELEKNNDRQGKSKGKKAKSIDININAIKEDAENQEQLQFYVNDATPEAVYDNVELINKIKKGYICSKSTEYAQYYEKSVYDKTANNSQFLNIFYDAYDGFYSSRKIRGKMRPEIEGITTCSIWQSDFSRMQDTLINTNFKNRCNDGYVRRIIPFYDPKINYTLYPPKEPTLDEITYAKEMLGIYSQDIKENYEKIAQDTVYKVDKETIQILKDWHREICMERARELYKGRNRQLDLNNAILEKCLTNAKWTILKLLVLIHMINEPEKIIVTDTYLNDAILFWEKGYEYWQNIIFNKNYTDIDTLVDYFLSNENTDLTKTDVREGCNFDKNFFKNLFDNALPEVTYMLNDLGYNLEEYNGRRNTIIYRCRKIDGLIPQLINVSVCPLRTMNETPTKYEYQELDVKDFVKLLKGKTAFVPCQLKNGERKSANNIGNQNTIWLDFDDIKSMEAIKTLFEDYSYVAYTSKNHQKEKNGVVSDRFRLILFTNCLMPIETDRFKRVMNNLITIYKADAACKDLARLFWSNPDTEVFLNKGKLFDWRPYDVDNSENYQIAKSNIVKRGKGKTIADVLFTPEGDRRLRVEQVKVGQRNSELFRIAIFLCHLVIDKEIAHTDAILKIKEIINGIDKTDFKQQEIERMINIVERLAIKE